MGCVSSTKANVVELQYQTQLIFLIGDKSFNTYPLKWVKKKFKDVVPLGQLLSICPIWTNGYSRGVSDKTAATNGRKQWCQRQICVGIDGQSFVRTCPPALLDPIPWFPIRNERRMMLKQVVMCSFKKADFALGGRSFMRLFIPQSVWIMSATCSAFYMRCTAD